MKSKQRKKSKHKLKVKQKKYGESKNFSGDSLQLKKNVLPKTDV